MNTPTILSQAELRRLSTSGVLTCFLMLLHEAEQGFELVFSDRNYRSVAGCYDPRKHRIYVNNNHASLGRWLEVAIHEYAHHIHCTEGELLRRDPTPHGETFKRLNHELTLAAQAKGLTSRCPALRRLRKEINAKLAAFVEGLQRVLSEHGYAYTLKLQHNTLHLRIRLSSHYRLETLFNPITDEDELAALPALVTAAQQAVGEAKRGKLPENLQGHLGALYDSGLILCNIKGFARNTKWQRAGTPSPSPPAQV